MEADTPVLWESLGKETQVLTCLRKPPLSWDNSSLCPSVQEQSFYSLNPNQKKRGGGGRGGTPVYHKHKRPFHLPEIKATSYSLILDHAHKWLPGAKQSQRYKTLDARYSAQQMTRME